MSAGHAARAATSLLTPALALRLAVEDCLL